MIRIGTTQDLADTVGLLRQLAGVTQTALAEVMGCHPARIGEYERHRRKVSVRVALIHLRALGYELAVVPLKPDAPEGAPGSTESAEPPVPGVLGCAGVDLEALRASEAVSGGAPSLADTIIEVGPFAPGEEMGGLGMALHRSADLNELRDELIELRAIVAKCRACTCGHDGLDEMFHVRPCPVAERRFARLDVTGTDQPPRSEWACGPECPKEA